MNKNQRIALAEKELQIKDLSFKLNLHPNYVSNILAGRYRAEAARRKISEILEKPEEYLWPAEEMSSASDS